MSKTKEELVQFRMNKGNEALELANYSVSRQFWNSAGSELYYACFYYVQALFAHYEIKALTHTGAITSFGLHFVKTNKVEIKWGRLLRSLFDLRQKGDYGDFMVLTEEEVVPLVDEVREFISLLKNMIQERN